MKHMIILELSELKEIVKDAVKDAVDSLTPRAAPSDEVEYITRKEVAKLLNVTVTTVDTWARMGRLTKYRIRAVVRFKKNEVLEALKSFQKYKR